MKHLCVLLLAFPLLSQTYRVKTASGVVEMSSEAYVSGVVTGESSIFKSDDALKAMAVAARTYAARMRGRHAKEGFDFCSTTHCQRFVTASPRATKAARDTAAQLLWFKGLPAFTAYSRSCGRKTETVSAVWPDITAPYLSSHPDPYCARTWTWTASPKQIQAALAASGLKVPSDIRVVAVVRRNSSGRAQTLSLDGDLVSASAFRFAIGRFLGWNNVRSEQYTVETVGDQILFRGSGEGHGVGLCQMGADQMGISGKSYQQILAFYYPGAKLATNPDFHWTRLKGELVVLYTQLPDPDRVALATAESLVRHLQARFHFQTPPTIDIYAYPSLDSFRNATGEPGWIAARTTGTKIELEPVTVLVSHNALRAILEHEILHCFVEFTARPGLPVWFREGFVEYYSRHNSQTNANEQPLEEAMRQRQNRKAAEDSYSAAAAKVQSLVNIYGQTTVLTWLERGLPAEVKNSNRRNPAVNNR